MRLAVVLANDDEKPKPQNLPKADDDPTQLID